MNYKKILSCIFFLIFLFSEIYSYSADYEKEYYTKLVFVEWRLFGKLTSSDYGKKIDSIELKTWGRIFPYLSRFERISKIIDFYFADSTHIDYVNSRLRKNTSLKFRILENIHSALDDKGYYPVELSEDYYQDDILVLPSGIRGKLEITKIKKRKGLLNNGKIYGRIAEFETWYGDTVYLEEVYNLKSRPNINVLMGGIGYVVAGFRGAVSGLTISNTQNVFLKKGDEFFVKIEKDIPVWE